MTEWLYEDGIGEARAALVADGAIIEAAIETSGARVGSVFSARLTRILIPGRRGIATFDGGEALIEPLDRATEGAAIRIAITREAIAEPGHPKRVRARLTDADVGDGPDLRARLAATGLPVREMVTHGVDDFEAAGWSELVESAWSGLVAFDGGALRISPTPAMTLIDIDGSLDPAALAVAGAAASAAAIRRFGLGGSIGIDLPTTGAKAVRLAAAAAFDALMPHPFERTAVNGFGFMQVIRARPRMSLIEALRADPPAAHARALLRRAARSGLIGSVVLTAAPREAALLTAHPAWLQRLARSLGGDVAVTADATLAPGAGYASAP